MAWARSEARALCEQIVAQLRLSYRLALQYRYVEARSNAVAAERLGIAVTRMSFSCIGRSGPHGGAARNIGLIPAVTPLLLSTASRLRDGLRRPRRRAGVCAKATARTAIAGIPTVLLVQAVAFLGTQPSSPPVVHVAAPESAALRAAARSTDTNSIDDAVLTDAVVRQSREGATTVVALGQGKLCGCSEVFRR